MSRRRRIIFTLPIVAAATWFLLWWSPWRSSYDSARMHVEWRTNTGRPWFVEGQVLGPNGQPLPGISIQVDNDSGGNSTTTDSQGRFELQMGEPAADALVIEGVDRIDWHLTGLNIQRGASFTIHIK